MKIRRSLLFAAAFAGALFFGPRPAYASAPVYDADFFSNPSLGYSTTSVLDVGTMDSLNMHAIYSSATISAFSLDDGRKATGTITFVSTQSLTNARVAVNSCVFDQGSEWTAVSTSSGNASALRTAFAASNCLSGIVVSSWTGGTSAVVSLTASAIGTAGNAITLFTNVSSITLSGATLSNGDDSSFDLTTEKVTTSGAHGISTGLPLLFAKVTGTVPTGLTDATTYYAIVTDNNKFELADTSTNSLVGTAINITAQTGAGTFTLTPTAFAGTWSFNWQASNDKTNWFTLPITAVTYSTPSSSMWDGPIYYRYLRLNITAGTGGGLSLRVRGYGKRNAP